MLEETATVVAVNPTGIWVETVSQSSCSQCGSHGCGSSVVAKLFGARRNRLQLPPAAGVQTGDRVVIGLPDAVLVKASLAAYLLPLITMLISALIGQGLGYTDGIQALLALGGLAAGLFLLKRLVNLPARRKHWTPRLLRHEVTRQEIPIRMITPDLLQKTDHRE